MSWVYTELADDTKWGLIDSLVGRESLQRDLDRLECLIITNCMKFNESKKAGFCTRDYSHGSLYTHEGQEADGKCSPEERDLGVLIVGKLSKSQQCILVARSASYWCVKHSTANQPKEMNVPLALCGFLGSTIWEEYRNIRKKSKGNKDSEKIRWLDLWGVVEDT